MIGQAHTNRGSGFYFLGAVLVRDEFAVIYDGFTTSGGSPEHLWASLAYLGLPLAGRAPASSKNLFQKGPGQPRPQNGSKPSISHKEFNCKMVTSFFWKSASSLLTPLLCSRVFFVYTSSLFTRLLRLRFFFLISGPQPPYLYRFKP